jgi:serine O-acetyltransferase
MGHDHQSDEDETAACRITHDITVKHRHQLPGIIARLVNSSRRPELFAHVDAELIPSLEKTIEVIQRARRLLFPGYFGGQVLDANGLEYAVGMEVTQLFEDLSQLIALSIRHDCRRYQMVCTHCQERGQEDAVAFLDALPEIREVLTTDIQAAYDGDPSANECGSTRASLWALCPCPKKRSIDYGAPNVIPPSKLMSPFTPELRFWGVRP